MVRRNGQLNAVLTGLAMGEGVSLLTDRGAKINLDVNSTEDPIRFSYGKYASLAFLTTRSLSRGASLSGLAEAFLDWSRQNAPQEAVEDTAKETPHNVKENEDDLILSRVVPFALYMRATYGEDFINKERAMDELHHLISLNFNYPRAMIASGFITLLVDQLLRDSDFRIALENALALTYEYYVRYSIYRDELTVLERLNIPDFGSLSISALNSDGQITHTIEATVWSLLRSTTYNEALSNALKFSRNTGVGALVGALAALSTHGENELPPRLVNSLRDRGQVLHTTVRIANRSGHFRMDHQLLTETSN